MNKGNLINYTIPKNINISIISKNIIEIYGLGAQPRRVSKVAADIHAYYNRYINNEL